MTQKKDTGFDAFFQAVTTTPEFKKVVEKDWSGDIWKSLKEMEKNIAKAWDIAKAFQDTFATPEALETASSISAQEKNRELREAAEETGTQKQTKNPWDGERKQDIKVEYFTMKNPDTWGFAGVAGMKKLKDDLREGFIRPLQFLFLVRDLKIKYETMTEAGIDTPEEKKEKMLVDLYASYEKFQVSIPTGMLFYGPPGTGKTFLTKKLAEELWAGLITKSVWEFGSSYLHETSKNIREFFAAAKEASKKWPIILFLDEIDALVSKRTNNVDAHKAEEVSQFLQEFNALSEAPNLIVVAATNRPDHLDSAILRSGRLDKKYYLGAPDFQARKELFEIYLKKSKRPHAEDINFEKLAEFTDWYVSADIEAIVEEAARDASGSILDIAEKLQKHSWNLDDFKDALQDHVITQALLELAISETVSSLKMVDMSVFENWEKTLS